jgi:small redox-active disulfide protein 2
MNIKILGPGCINCRTLEQRTFNALAELNMDANVEKVEKYPDIVSFGIMATPGLVIDGKVVVQGRVPTVRELKEIFTANQEKSESK